MPGIDKENWRIHAACRGVDPEVFFSPRQKAIREAKAYCAACPSVCRYHCVTEGNELKDPGVRGGLTTGERQAKYGVRLRYEAPPDEEPMRDHNIPEEVLRRTGRFLRPDQIAWAKKLYADGWPVTHIAALFGVKHNSINYHVKGAA